MLNLYIILKYIFNESGVYKFREMNEKKSTTHLSRVVSLSGITRAVCSIYLEEESI